MTTKTSGWRWVLILFFITSMIESLGMSHVYAFLPVYLVSLGVQHIPLWVGLLNALTFIVGLPLVPLWGVWAARFGGKAVIIRSAYVETIVFAMLGLSHSFPQVFVAMAVVGFQLGNTGIMLSSIRRLVPAHHIGLAVSAFSVSSPVGMAIGPLFGGWLVDATSMSLHMLYGIDALLSLAAGTMLLIFYHDVPTSRTSEGIAANAPAWGTAWNSVRVTFSLRITWILFGIYTILMMSRQMVNPYLPIVIQRIYHNPQSMTTAIGGLMGLTALIGALITVVAGKIGDRIGFKEVLVAAFGCNIACATMLGFAHRLPLLGVWLTGFSAATSISVAMIFALLSTRVPESHRTTSLNLVYLPLYVGGILGPAVSSAFASTSMVGPFVGGGVASAIGFTVAAFALRNSAAVHPTAAESTLSEHV